MFEKMKLRQRILLGYVVPFALLLMVMGVVYSELRTASRDWAAVNDSALFVPDVLAAGDSLVRIQRAAYAYILMNGKTDVAGGYPKQIFDRSEQRFRALVERLAAEGISDLYREDLRRMAEVGNDIIRVNRHYMALIDAGKEREAVAEFRRGESVKLAAKIDPLADGIVRAESERRVKLRASVSDAIGMVRTTVLIGTVLAIALIMVLGLWVATMVTRSITANATQLSSAASEIAATVVQHERTAAQQASVANETSATLEELSVSSSKSAEQAANAAALAQQAGAATAEGDDAIRQAVAAMANLKERMGAMAEQIVHLSEQTGQIGNIASLVKDIAAQINMLALNAAVEAARAGEHGKGFAVVAGEVRALAVESRKSAEQAGLLVADVQKAANSSVMMTEDGTRTVAEATQLAGRVAELFGRLAGMAGSVNENAQQVMLNARQQAAAFGQIVEATNSIASGAKETAAGIGQTKVGVQNLNQAAENLKAIA